MTRLLTLERYFVEIDSHPILRAMELEISRGETLVLVGGPSAGKSTLLRSLCYDNIERGPVESRGDAYYNGKPITDGHRPTFAESRPESLQVNLLEYLACHADRHTSFARRDLVARCQKLLREHRLPRLAGKLGESMFKLTTSERIIATLLRAKLASDGLICIDEPMSELTRPDIGRVQRLIREMGRDYGILLTTRRREYGAPVADRILRLERGVLYETTPRTTIPEANQRDGRAGETKGSAADETVPPLGGPSQQAKS